LWLLSDSLSSIPHEHKKRVLEKIRVLIIKTEQTFRILCMNLPIGLILIINKTGLGPAHCINKEFNIYEAFLQVF